MKLTLLAVMITSFLSVSVPKCFSQPANVQDSLALVDLYDSTNGSGWSSQDNWLSSKPLNTWLGVTVAVSGRVTELRLGLFGLLGIIPQSISNLSSLQYLDLSDNKLSGNSVQPLTGLLQLQFLDMHGSSITSIPTSIGNLSNLQTLNLDHNQITGPIPSEIGNLSNLKIFDVQVNQITGSIPAAIGRLSNLEELYIDVNQCTGPIPSELGNLTKLKKCWLRNHLTGDIPSSLGNLTQLEELLIPDNQLSGYIPPELNNIPGIIYIYNNKLTFFGMEQLATNHNVTYAPQAPIPIFNQNNTLSVAAGGTPSNDTFRLYKDGVLNTLQIGDSTFPITTTGKYNIVVTNSIATKLTLYSDTLDISSLPITLSSFSATKKQTSILLDWQTANEQNNAYFIVERSNSNNTKFREVGRVNSKGNSNHLQQYSFEDLNPFDGANYYRLTQVDADGKSTYSKVVLADFSKTITIKLYPNPVTDVLRIEGLNKNASTTISLINTQGQLVSKNSTSNSAYSLDVKQLSIGTYFVKIESEHNSTTFKFVKE